MTDEQLDRMLRDADPYGTDVIGHLDGAEQTLLEEIMSVPTVDDITESSRPDRDPRRIAVRRAAGVLTAAAVLAVAVVVPTVLRSRSDTPPVVPGGSSAPDDRPVLGGTPIVYSAAVLKAAEDNPRLLIDQPGWRATTVYGFADSTGTIGFVDGDRSLEMNWYPASQYDSYYIDRLEVSKPEPVTVDNMPGALFRYSANDFAVMLRPRDGSFVEFRTSGDWTRDTFDPVLADVIRVDVRTWLAALPPEIVTPDRVAARAAEVLADIPLPPGFDTSSLNGVGTNDAYQFGAQVTRRVGCAWIAEWLRAKRTGDDAALKKAVDALGSSRRWQVLHQMNDEGDWPESFWGISDAVAAGMPPTNFAESLECG